MSEGLILIHHGVKGQKWGIRKAVVAVGKGVGKAAKVAVKGTAKIATTTGRAVNTAYKTGKSINNSEIVRDVKSKLRADSDKRVMARTKNMQRSQTSAHLHNTGRYAVRKMMISVSSIPVGMIAGPKVATGYKAVTRIANKGAAVYDAYNIHKTYKEYRQM